MKLDHNGNCVLPTNCPCVTEDGTLLKAAGLLIAANGEECTCFNNELTCGHVTEPTYTTTPDTIVVTTPRDDCVVWEKFINLNRPSSNNGNDLEDIESHVFYSECKNPIAIDCRVAKYNIPYHRYCRLASLLNNFIVHVFSNFRSGQNDVNVILRMG